MKITKYIKSILYFLISIFITTLIITILNYLNLIDQNTISFLKITALIISLTISGIYIAKKATSKKIIEGLKIGIIVVILSFIISLFTKNSLSFSKGLYFLIILISPILGSMIAKPNYSK